MPRSVDLRLDPQTAKIAYVERASLVRRTNGTKQDRMLIPAKGRQCVAWLQDKVSIKVLIELAEPGCLIVRPWSPYGEEVVARLQSVEVDDGIDIKDRSLIVGASIKFLPSTIEASARLTFHEPFERHLAISPGESPELYVLCSVDRIEIWSEQYYTDAHRRLGGKLRKFFPWSGTQY